MKKAFSLSIIGILTLLAAGCSSSKHDIVYDIQSIEPKTENLRQVGIPMKDFNAIGPVFAQTSISLSEFQSAEYESSTYDGDRFSRRYRKADGEHRVMMEGSYLIQRQLLQEAYKKGADAIVNINIEYENTCHLVGVSDNIDASTSYTHKVFDYDISGSASETSVQSAAYVNGKKVASEAGVASNSNLNLDLSTRTANTSNSYVYKFKEEHNDCKLIIYGSALSIKYTNAVVPTCSSINVHE